MPETETDELSFGDDREPWLRIWLATHRRAAALLAAVAVALAAAGAGGWYLHQRSLLPSPPPDVAFPEPVGVVVGLCVDGIGCPKGTAGQVLKLVRDIPEVVSPRLVTAAESEMSWAMRVITDEGLARRPDVRWAPYVEGGLRDGADYETVRARLAGRRGVLSVNPRTPDFWAGKADLSVMMCGTRQEPPWAAGCGHGAATEAQRDAVVARLREIDGVEEVFLQDKAFALRLARHGRSDTPLTLDDMTETVYVRFDDASKAKAAGQAMLRMPGVGWAQLIR